MTHQFGHGPSRDGTCQCDTCKVCRDLMVHQRFRASAIKLKVMTENSLTATIAPYFGYGSQLTEDDREERWSKAEKLLSMAARGKSPEDEESTKILSRCGGLITSGLMAIEGFEKYIGGYTKEMNKLVQRLPASAWVASVRGFGQQNLSIIIGECGNLADYPYPVCVLKRLGCMAFKGRMGAYWKSKGGLSAEEWTRFGYSPRRRSIAFMLALSLVNGNKEKYRHLYDAVKLSKSGSDPKDWPKLRIDRHARLLMTKRAIIDLWAVWNGKSRENELKIPA